MYLHNFLFLTFDVALSSMTFHCVIRIMSYATNLTNNWSFKQSMNVIIMHCIILFIIKNSSAYFTSLRIYSMIRFHMFVHTFARSFRLTTWTFPDLFILIIYNISSSYIVIRKWIRCIPMIHCLCFWIIGLFILIFVKRAIFRIWSVVSFYLFWICIRKIQITLILITWEFILFVWLVKYWLLFDLIWERKLTRMIFWLDRYAWSPAPISNSVKKN